MTHEKRVRSSKYSKGGEHGAKSARLSSMIGSSQQHQRWQALGVWMSDNSFALADHHCSLIVQIEGFGSPLELLKQNVMAAFISAPDVEAVVANSLYVSRLVGKT